MRLRVEVTINDTKLRHITRNMAVAADDMASAAADAVVEGAQQRAPVRTGYLRDSIFHLKDGKYHRVIVTAGYAYFVEFGTRFMAAIPYLRPALEALDKRQIVDQFFKQLGLR